MPILQPQKTLRRAERSLLRAPQSLRRAPPVVPRVPLLNLVKPRLFNAVPEWASSLQLLGDGVVYFTIFYCSMNWLFYKNLREDAEAAEDSDDDE
jgi:hypothetical protein